MIPDQLLVALIPLVLLELVLKVVCYLDWRSRDAFAPPGRIPWLLIFLFVNLFGPIAYLLIGRRDHERP